MGEKPNIRELLLQTPIIQQWLQEQGIANEDVQSIQVECPVVRDVVQETKNKTPWRCYRPGDVYKVTVVLTDTTGCYKLFTRQVVEDAIRKYADEGGINESTHCE